MRSNLGNLKLFVFLAILIFLTPLAEARPRNLCVRDILKARLWISVDIRDPGLKKDIHDEFREIIVQMDHYFGDYFARPKELHVTVDSKSLGESRGNSITVPYQYFDKHPKFAKPTTAHEYTHVIYRLTMARDFPELDELVREAALARQAAERDAQEQLAALEREINRSSWERIAQQSSAESEKTYQQALDRLNRFRSEKGYLLPSNAWGNTPIDRPYSELFSDLAQVIYGDDPDAVKSAISSTAEPLPKKEQRGFLDRVKISGWNEGEEHSLLNPMRSFIWTKYLSNPRYSKQKPEILKRVFQAIRNELADIRKEQLFNLSPEEANRRLQVKLEEAFTDF